MFSLKISLAVFITAMLHLAVADSCLDAHNRFRANHNTPNLSSPDSDLQNYANKRAADLAATDNFAHPSNAPYGENLFNGYGKDFTCEDAVAMWYDEIKDYNFDKPGFGGNTGHFTQVVWKGSKQVACAKSKSPKSGRIYVVCNYSPHGNYMGQFKENVLPPKGNLASSANNSPGDKKDNDRRKPASSSGDGLSAAKCQAEHNKERRAANLPPMKLADKELQAYAQMRVNMVAQDSTAGQQPGIGERIIAVVGGNAPEDCKYLAEKTAVGKSLQITKNAKQVACAMTKKGNIFWHLCAYSMEDPNSSRGSKPVKTNRNSVNSGSDNSNLRSDNKSSGSDNSPNSDSNDDLCLSAIQKHRASKNLPLLQPASKPLAEYVQAKANSYATKSNAGPDAPTATTTEAIVATGPTLNCDKIIESLAKYYGTINDADNKQGACASNSMPNGKTAYVCAYSKEDPKEQNEEAARGPKTTDPESCLAAHNMYRAQHGTKDMKLPSSKLQAYANKRANELAVTDKFAHPASSPYGENLFAGSGKDYHCADAVKSWYKEIEDYDFDKPGFNGGTGHFTQVIWAGTNEVACAKSKSDKSGYVYIVCNYDPPGNYLGQFEENVSPKV